MAAFLSQEWFELQRELGGKLPKRSDATACLQIMVAGAPGGDVAYVQEFVDGRMIRAELGNDEGAEATLTQKYADAVAIARGELDASAAFMQGRIKVVGPMGPLMATQPVLQSAEHRSMLTELAASTTF